VCGFPALIRPHWMNAPSGTFKPDLSANRPSSHGLRFECVIVHTCRCAQRAPFPQKKKPNPPLARPRTRASSQLENTLPSNTSSRTAFDSGRPPSMTLCPGCWLKRRVHSPEPQHKPCLGGAGLQQIERNVSPVMSKICHGFRSLPEDVPPVISQRAPPLGRHAKPKRAGRNPCGSRYRNFRTALAPSPGSGSCDQGRRRRFTSRLTMPGFRRSGSRAGFGVLVGEERSKEWTPGRFSPTPARNIPRLGRWPGGEFLLGALVKHETLATLAVIW